MDKWVIVQMTRILGEACVYSWNVLTGLGGIFKENAIRQKRVFTIV